MTDNGTKTPGEGAGSLVRRRDQDMSPGRADAGIARMRHSTALVPTVLETRRIIHADRADHRSTDLFRELRTCLLHASGMGNPIILVSGVRAHCGASYVARNLAAAIAMQEDRTALLIDCNMRRASHDIAFDTGGRPGLSDFLNASDVSLEQIIHATGVARLRVIPAGTAARRNCDQLGSLRMRALLESLRQRYGDRCLVLDAPPACGSPEARVLAQHANLVVLVAGEALHTPEQVLEAARVFDPAKFAGVVFNEMP